MITLKEASERIQKRYPVMRILSCYDSEQAYSFTLVPRRWNGDAYDLPCGSTSYVILKTDGSLYLDDIIDEKYPPGDELPEVYAYMSPEDVAFAKTAMEALRKWPDN